MEIPASVRYHGHVTGMFAGFGAFSSRHSFSVIFFGTLLLFLFSMGNVLVEEQLELDELWVEKGTRITHEKKYFEEKFGGLPRQQFISIRDAGGGSITEEKHLNALKDALVKVNAVVYTDPESGGKTITDFCERPAVPKSLSEVTFRLLGSDLPSYAKLLRDLTNDARLGITQPLPTDWLINQFPCSRATVLDCFKQGGFDYPVAMQKLDLTAPHFWASLSNTTLNQAWRDVLGASSVSATGITFPSVSTTGFYATLTAQSISNQEAIKYLTEFWGLTRKMMTWGYWWRIDYTQTSDILEVINQGVRNNHEKTTTQLGACSIDPLFARKCCLTWSGQKIPAQVILGDYTNKGGPGSAPRYGATRTVLTNFNENHPGWVYGAEAGSNAKVHAKAWEQLFIDTLQPLWDRTNTVWSSGGFKNSKLDFMAWRSSNDVIEDGSTPEVGLLLAGVGAMWLYIIFALSKVSFPYTGTSAVYGRVGLGTAGLIVLVFSTIAGFGLTSICGIKLSPIATNLVPFLSLGIGIDDMFVLVNTLASFSHEKTVVRRMKFTLGVAGPSVFLTSFTNAVAFGLASLTPLPAVQSFSQQMSLTSALNFTALMFLFVPFMAMDSRRTLSKRADICVLPCTHLSGKVGDEDELPESTIKQFVENRVSGCLTQVWVKIILIFSFLTFFAAMAVIAFTSTESGLRISDIALKGSFTRDYVDLQERYFGAYGGFLVTSGNHSGIEFQKSLLQVQQYFQAESKFLVKSLKLKDVAWYADESTSFRTYASTIQGATLTDGTISPMEFNREFATWMRGIGSIYANDIFCQKRTTKERVACSQFSAFHEIGATKMLFFDQGLFEQNNFLDAIRDNRGLVDGNSNGNMYAYGYVFQYWEQYMHIFDNLYIVCGWALLAVFLATFAFQFSAGASIIICCIIFKITVELYGFMTIIGAKLNAFSVVNLVMSIGMAVEFTAHISHVFLIMHGNRDERMRGALREMSTPMVHGAATSFVAVFMLVFSRFPFFRIYYFGMMVAMILIAFLNGMVFLPIVLSLVGPRSFHDHGGDQEDDEMDKGAVTMERIGSQPSGMIMDAAEDEQIGERGEF